LSRQLFPLAGTGVLVVLGKINAFVLKVARPVSIPLPADFRLLPSTVLPRSTENSLARPRIPPSSFPPPPLCAPDVNLVILRRSAGSPDAHPQPACSPPNPRASSAPPPFFHVSWPIIRIRASATVAPTRFPRPRNGTCSDFYCELLKAPFSLEVPRVPLPPGFGAPFVSLFSKFLFPPFYHPPLCIIGIQTRHGVPRPFGFFNPAPPPNSWYEILSRQPPFFVALEKRVLDGSCPFFFPPVGLLDPVFF